MAPLRVAVIGAGRLGGFHAQKLARMANVELVGVVDPLAANRDRLAAELHTGSFSSHAALLGRIDAAVIASPTVLHHRLAVDLLEAGTHLLIEKPICTTVAEADELVDLARRERLVLQVGHVERFNPALAAAVPHARNPKFIEAVRASGFTFRSMDVGVVLDLMIHDIDVVLSLVRSPLRSVEALGVAYPGRPRGRGPRPIGIPVRLRGQLIGLAGLLRNGPQDADLDPAGLREHRFWNADDDAGAAQ